MRRRPNRDYTRRGFRWAPETPAGITFEKYGENERSGYSYGGFTVFWHGVEIGKIERYYPTWERKPKGLRYVTARGTSTKAEFRIKAPALDADGREHPTRAYLVEDLLKSWQEKHGVKKLQARIIRIDPHEDCTGPHEIDETKVGRYAEAKRTGTEFPPVRLVAYAGFFAIIDGHHRVAACQMIEHSFDALVVDGDEFEQLDCDLRDAQIGKRADDIEFWTIPEPEEA